MTPSQIAEAQRLSREFVPRNETNSRANPATATFSPPKAVSASPVLPSTTEPPAATTRNWEALQRGASKERVRELLGERDVYRGDIRSGDGFAEEWRYLHGRKGWVRFNQSGEVVSWQEE